jgi:16S rRNA (guanine527-N7)-methyltransferase
MADVNAGLTDELLETLRLAQRLGFFGSGDLRQAMVHAGHFASAIPDESRLVIDLGSGGGLPGLVIAVSKPQVAVVLIERRQARADFLLRAVSRLGLQGQVRVVATDVDVVAQRGDYQRRADVVTARGFAQPAVTAQVASSLVRPGGLIVVSDPPGPSGPARWLAVPLGSWQLEYVHSDGIVSVLRRPIGDIRTEV